MTQFTEEEIQDKSDEMLAILENFDDEEERERAKQELMETYGIDPDTRLAVESEETGKQEDLVEAEAEAGQKEEGQAEEKELTPEEQLQAQIAEQAQRIAELETNLKLNSEESDQKMRSEADEKLRERNESLTKEEEEVEAKLKEFEEQYGEEAAEDFKKALMDSIKVKKDAIEKDWQHEYDQAKQRQEAEAQGESALQADINKVPELSEWQRDEKPQMWMMAVAVDEHLKANEEWRDKPQVERFEEVVKRVKIASGLQSGTQSEGNGKANTREQIESLVKQEAKSSMPQSLSDLPGGSEPDKVGELSEDVSINDLMSMTPESLMEAARGLN